MRVVKTRFISDNKKTKGRGVGQTINKKIGEKVPGFQQAQDAASIIMGVTGGDKKLFDKYWSGDIANWLLIRRLDYSQRNSGLGHQINKILHVPALYGKTENGIILIVINI